jgi:SecD/SecF fusion protein
MPESVTYWDWYVTLPVLAAVLVVPIWLGQRLARRWRMPDYGGKFSLVLFTLFAGVAISYYGWSTNHIQLGIDLKGGSYLVYEITKVEEGADQADGAGGGTAAGRMSQEKMDKLVTALRRRVDPSGTLGVKIRAYGTRQIEIKAPQVDQEQVDYLKNVLARVGTLEFRILADNRRPIYRSYIQRAEKLGPKATEVWEERKEEDKEAKLVARWVPVVEKKEIEFQGGANFSYLGTRWITDERGRKHLEVLVVEDDYDVTGELLTRSTPGESKGKPCVNFTFNAEGAQKFSRLTSSHLEDPDLHFFYDLGIILDGKIQTAPRIITTIYGSGEITGDFTNEQVKELVDVLNAGALPAALSPQPISERTTGPELGADTIQRGQLSMVVALSFVFVSVLVYYRFAGIVACIALAMNAVLLLACMIIINAEFSLAGIAGFALSIGMAVDANVLIYERMREEAGRGAALRMTIRNGFERALSAIVDSNLTTLITAVILYAVGSDQVRGFAVTLFLGIVLSMYTAIFVARVIFDVAERRRWIERVKMMRAIPTTHFDFLRYKWVMMGISLSIVLIGLVATAFRGRGILDIDFTGGVSVETVFQGSPGIAEVRKAMEDVPEEERLPDVTVREVSRFRRAVSSRHLVDLADGTTEEVALSVRSGKASIVLPNGTAEEVRVAVEGNKAFVTLPDGMTVSGGTGKEVALSEAQKIALGETEERKSFIIDASDPSGGEDKEYGATVKRRLEEIFRKAGLELAHNTMEFKASEIPSAAAAQRSAPGARPELAGLTAALLGQTGPAKPVPAAEGAKKEAGPAPAASPPPTAPPTKPPVAQETAPPAKAPAGKETAAPAKAPAGKETAPPAKAPAGPAKVPSVEKPKPPDPFAGGTQAHLTFAQNIDHGTLKALFEKAIEAREGPRWKEVTFVLENDAYEPGSLSRFDTWNARIKLPLARATAVFQDVADELQSTPFFPSSDTIGGEVAKQTRYRAVWALAASAFFILLYLWVRFQRVSYGLGAIVSLVHDVFITLAAVAVSVYLAPVLGFILIEPFKINIIMMTAFLTIAGYSLNDTIVIFDRIREVRGKASQVTQEMINTSINQTLGRTLLTGLTSMMVIVTLYILGGPTIHGFAFAMIIGVVTGTYSSIYIASPFLLWISRKSDRR